VVSVNLIFHIVSALTFVVLIWYLLHLQSQVAFLRDLTGSLSSAHPKLKVDWPEAFVRRLAEAYGISFQLLPAVGADAKLQKLPPQKIDIRLWAELHQQLGLEAIEWSAARCRLRVRRNLDLDQWAARLEASLQGKISVEWSASFSFASSSSKGG